MGPQLLQMPGATSKSQLNAIVIAVYEAFGDAVGVFTTTGDCLGRTSTFLVGNNRHETEQIRSFIFEFVKEAATRARFRCIGPVIANVMSVDASVAGTAWRLTATFCEAGTLVADRLILIKATNPFQTSNTARFGLTKKQVAVARLIASGLKNTEIANRLFISEHTARHHVEQIRMKLGVKTRSGIAAKMLSCECAAAE
jgi:DNA-binding CsgD family transcriptional regulator